jgi:hypothetical protein
VSSNGTWNGGQSDPVRIVNGNAQLDVPAGSAALIALMA